jgi:isoleucyl-tRNA synthetase
VTADSGVGIVHQAPYFGADDFRVCKGAGIVSEDQEPICPIDAKGRFILPVRDFLGQYVKVSRVEGRISTKEIVEVKLDEFLFWTGR